MVSACLYLLKRMGIICIFLLYYGFGLIKVPCSCWKSTVHSFRSHILLLFTLFMIISFCKILISHAKGPMKVYNHSSTLSYSKSTVIDTYTLQMRVSNPKFLVVLLPPIILLILTTIIRLNLIIYVCIYIIFGE